MYLCVWFELKFSTGQVAPKPDSPVQTGHLATLTAGRGRGVVYYP